MFYLFIRGGDAQTPAGVYTYTLEIRRDFVSPTQSYLIPVSLYPIHPSNVELLGTDNESAVVYFLIMISVLTFSLSLCGAVKN